MPGGQMSWMPTFVTVPATTGAKSQTTVPELVLMVLVGGVPWAETTRVWRNRRKTAEVRIRTTTDNQATGRMDSIFAPPRESLPSFATFATRKPSKEFPEL